MRLKAGFKPLKRPLASSTGRQSQPGMASDSSEALGEHLAHLGLESASQPFWKALYGMNMFRAACMLVHQLPGVGNPMQILVRKEESQKLSG